MVWVATLVMNPADRCWRVRSSRQNPHAENVSAGLTAQRVEPTIHVDELVMRNAVSLHDLSALNNVHSNACLRLRAPQLEQPVAAPQWHDQFPWFLLPPP
ncbi:hypothetical protein SV7mr_33970 [Stieleria bergensis]|uniref:Uncharacterized protein n=1 Tax=Stieleria bergensis TaxID=2528025 RepID=A0A517SXJ5_9BACT|nr:hypothetical protein SV7mr_33970 [Planctomycetes bacterium SV_7m_r]